MALTKAQIVEEIHNQLGLPAKQCATMVEDLLEIIKSSLENGDDVLISGFGKFRVRDKSQRRGRNPATGDSIILDARKVVTFTCSGVLRDRINSNEKG
ncbi:MULTISPECIES: integration host factor subunit alpha [Desulfatibacillum]|jgi:integration host factor subunit alpha|uniref:Integration host factor subunit alpha n=2 Tax=Desulfatibacillum TaxID=218207 RepID=B8FAQ7_DESAL|nr:MULTISPECIES: integration host factor subunit alpha [Desulfatibacillum]ACL03353.1 histone family protein DNA-binding protein [Desulfatibacillum aliphaticivorans]SHK37674.1 integration host factor subunit alpha [Desulfatibacillum alkenivorans DSM 16219]